MGSLSKIGRFFERKNEVEFLACPPFSMIEQEGYYGFSNIYACMYWCSPSLLIRTNYNQIELYEMGLRRLDREASNLREWVPLGEAEPAESDFFIIAPFKINITGRGDNLDVRVKLENIPFFQIDIERDLKNKLFRVNYFEVNKEIKL